MVEKLNLNLGCGDAFMKGFVNVDVANMEAPPGIVFHQADLNDRWPWPNSSVDFILARDVIEHLHNKIFTMNEIHRVLMPGSRVRIEIPTTDGNGAFQDPTHVSFWNRRSFLYYESGNIYRDRFAKSYGITAAFHVVAECITSSMDGPKLQIILEAVK